MYISIGDYQLNYHNPYGPPCLVPSPGLEKSLDFRHFHHENKSSTSSNPTTCAVHIHGYYKEELWDILDMLEGRINNFDLFITTNSIDKKNSFSEHLNSHPLACSAHKWQVIQVPDRGRNVGPLLIDLFDRLTAYDCVLHMHTKRSDHWGGTRIDAWKDSLHQNLAGSAELIRDIRGTFEDNPQLGLLIPQTSEAVRSWAHWGQNFSIARQILKGISHDLNLHIDAPLVFPVGMMFWFRPSALAKLSEACRNLQPLPLEPLQLDGSPLHAIERLVAHSCEASGYRWQLICAEETHDRSQHLDHQPSVLAPLTETYIRASSILGVEMRKLQIEMKNSVQSYENRIQQEAEALHLCQEELGQTKRKLELVEGELVRAQEEILALIDLNRVQSNRLSARVASGTVAAVAAIFNRSSYRKIYQRIYSNANEQASKN
jgi:lipopolysaccharide biosynthesis protein